MSNKLHVKTGDTVILRTGKYDYKFKNKDKDRRTGKVLEVSPKEGKVIVEGINMIKKTIKPNQNNPEGGIAEVEAKIDASNVMLYDKKAKTASRVGIKINEKGEKERIFKKSGEVVKGGKK